MKNPSKGLDKRRRLSANDARAIILDAATVLVSEHGLDGLRVRDVAKSARMSHATLLHHFGSREALMVALAERVIETLSEMTDTQPPPKTPDASCQAVMRHVERVIDTMSTHPAQFELLTEVFARSARDEVAGALVAVAEKQWITHLRVLMAPLLEQSNQGRIDRAAEAITILIRGQGLSIQTGSESLRFGVQSLLAAAMKHDQPQDI